MASKSWARSAARPVTGRGVRPAGSWFAAVARAASAWDALTAAPGPESTDRRRYTTEEAAVILPLALGLWADTAAGMGEEGGEDG